MSEQREHVIRERAYALWEQDGRPDGRSLAYWSQAETEIAAGQALADQDEAERVKSRRDRSVTKSIQSTRSRGSAQATIRPSPARDF
jgi:Protein of unknown function (DUF2934)